MKKRGGNVLFRCFCFLRYFSKFDLNDEGKKLLFDISDSAHNIPKALTENCMIERLEDDIVKLEKLLDSVKIGEVSRYLACKKHARLKK
ncbi:MAG: hypothetical protein ACYDAO_09445 [Thermoplasmataceae archaeon]